MQHRGAETVTVIENDRPAGIIHIAMHQGDDGIRWRDNRRPHRCRNIDAVVRLTWLTIEYSLAAINTRYPAQCRPYPTTFESGNRCILCPRFCNFGVFGTDAGVDGFGGRHHLARQSVNSLNLVGPFRDGKRTGHLTSIRQTHTQPRARTGVARETDQKAPLRRDPD